MLKGLRWTAFSNYRDGAGWMYGDDRAKAVQWFPAGENVSFIERHESVMSSLDVRGEVVDVIPAFELRPQLRRFDLVEHPHSPWVDNVFKLLD